jgi:signal transduction histidine kinase
MNTVPGAPVAATIPAMFRRRLTLALVVLAAAVVLQALGAVWALAQAERQVERGRRASDIQLGFVELSATKKELRSWVAQLQQGAGADPAERDRLQAALRTRLDELRRLADAARALDDSPAGRAEQARRLDALAVLGRTVDALTRTIAAAGPLTPGADARQAWDALSAVFDQSQGRDLRVLLANAIAQEAEAVLRKREAADRSMAWTRGLWLSMAATLALAALLVALHFARALRAPLQQLSEGALALEQGRLGHRVPAQRDAEFAAVARSMNTMAAALAEHQAREADERQRLEAEVAARTAELQGALQALRQADTRRRQLFADISHELRTPTTAIRGEAEITLRGRDRDAAEYRAALQRIVETSRQLGVVIDDLLAVARHDIDALALARRPVDLAEPLAEALAQAAPLAAERGVRLLGPASEPGAPTPRWPVLADPQRLAQLLVVLLDNAIGYSHRGGTVQLRVQPAAPGTLQVEVADQGIGIEAAELPQVFERHFRGAAARLHRADGMGLGLAIARALAQAHGGSLVLHSAPGQGTRAQLVLPLNHAVREAVAENAA